MFIKNDSLILLLYRRRISGTWGFREFGTRKLVRELEMREEETKKEKESKRVREVKRRRERQKDRERFTVTLVLLYLHAQPTYTGQSTDQPDTHFRHLRLDTLGDQGFDSTLCRHR